MKRLFEYFGWIWFAVAGAAVIQVYSKTLFPQVMAVLFVLSPGILSFLCKKAVAEDKGEKWASVHIARFVGLFLLSGLIVYNARDEIIPTAILQTHEPTKIKQVFFNEVISTDGSISCSTFPPVGGKDPFRECSDFVPPVKIAVGEKFSANGKEHIIYAITAGFAQDKKSKHPIFSGCVIQEARPKAEIGAVPAKQDGSESDGGVLVSIDKCKPVLALTRASEEIDRIEALQPDLW